MIRKNWKREVKKKKKWLKVSRKNIYKDLVKFGNVTFREKGVDKNNIRMVGWKEQWAEIKRLVKRQKEHTRLER